MTNLRSVMPALTNKSYFNYGGQGPLPTPSLEAITSSWRKLQELGPFTNQVWPYVTKEIEATRKYLAKMCGVTSNRIALTENVTTGCVLPLWGLPLTPGDHLLISNCEHPGIVSACREFARRKQLHIDVFPIKHLRQIVDSSTTSHLLESLESHLTPKTKLVVLSHLLWNTGQIMPIEAVSQTLANHPNNPYLLVDAAQSFGQIPISAAASTADIYAFTGHKWACGPEGLGGVSLSDRVLEESNPTLIGWRSLQHEASFEERNDTKFHQDSRRFEVATSCVPLLAGLRCSLNLLDGVGTEEERLKEIQSKSLELWSKLKDQFGAKTILEGPPPAGLISFTLPKGNTTKEIVKTLGKEALWIRDLEDPICLRACVHVTTTSKEISMLIDGVRKISS